MEPYYVFHVTSQEYPLGSTNFPTDADAKPLLYLGATYTFKTGACVQYMCAIGCRGCMRMHVKPAALPGRRATYTFHRRGRRGHAHAHVRARTSQDACTCAGAAGIDSAHPFPRVNLSVT